MGAAAAAVAADPLAVRVLAGGATAGRRWGRYVGTRDRGMVVATVRAAGVSAAGRADKTRAGSGDGGSGDGRGHGLGPIGHLCPADGAGAGRTSGIPGGSTSRGRWAAGQGESSM